MKTRPSIQHLPPDGQVRAMEAILAEGGYPPDGRIVAVSWDEAAAAPQVLWAPHLVPDELVWKAIVVSGQTSRCYPCWKGNVPEEDCDHDYEVT